MGPKGWLAAVAAAGAVFAVPALLAVLGAVSHGAAL